MANMDQLIGKSPTIRYALCVFFGQHITQPLVETVSISFRLCVVIILEVICCAACAAWRGHANLQPAETDSTVSAE